MAKPVNLQQYYMSELQRLDADHQAGIVNDSVYEFYKGKLIAEAAKGPHRSPTRIVFDVILNISLIALGLMVLIAVLAAL